MDINKIENKINGKFSKTDAASKGKPVAGTNGKVSAADTDRVTLSNYRTNNNEQLFAKIEIEKLNISSTGHLKELKTQLAEYQAALKDSPEAAGKTELGQKINNPSVWQDIAGKILK